MRTPFERPSTSLAVALLVAAVAVPLLAGQAPAFSPGGPNAEAYGQGAGYPVGTAATFGQQANEVGGFSHLDQIFPFRPVEAGPTSWPFRRADPTVIRYAHNGQVVSLEDYLTHVPVTGLLIAKDDLILAERYQYGRTDHDRLTSHSMSKTIVALLIGLAVADGHIASIQDHAEKYAPEFAGSAYGETSIRDLLHMSSGVRCPATMNLPDLLHAPGGVAGSLAHDCTRANPPGKTFQYSNEESEVLGVVARHAFGQPLATVLRDRIWQPMGAEASAEWTIDATGQETAYCCISAVLRDYARLGRLLAHDGSRDGTSLIGRSWLVDATSMSSADPQLEAGKPAPFFGYGYQVWILPDERRMFCLIGAYGQRIFVDPLAKLVMVQTAVETEEVDRALDAETIGLWLSLVAEFGHP